MNYSEKLKDPRWQKKRLKILERDGWQCTLCGDNETMLSVHHKFYEQGKDPWDCDDQYLTTLCQPCHDSEFQFRGQAETALLQAIAKKGFMASDIEVLAEAFSLIPIIYAPEVTASIVKFSLGTREVMESNEALFGEYLNAANKKTNS